MLLMYLLLIVGLAVLYCRKVYSSMGSLSFQDLLFTKCVYVFFFSGFSHFTKSVFLTAGCMFMNLCISLYALFFWRGNNSKEIYLEWLMVFQQCSAALYAELSFFHAMLEKEKWKISAHQNNTAWTSVLEMFCFMRINIKPISTWPLFFEKSQGSSDRTNTLFSPGVNQRQEV